jgi:ABC-2 type transport system ATP-binding protein
MSSSAIESTDLNVRKGHSDVLRNITFSVKAGTVTGLIGPSGSGKTTLMRSIIGVQAVSSGSLKVLGSPAGSRELRKKIGYVTQSPAVYPDLTVVQNLRYFAVLVGASRTNVDKVIKEVQLEKQRNQLAGSLSGGQLARVSLGVALLGNPELLVLDEPTVGLDPILRNQLWSMFAVLAHHGRTLLVSSHVMDEAERCDNLLLLRDGQLLWNDSKEKLLDHSKQKTVGDAFVAMIKHGEAK